jgi:hypothetical protein
MGWWCDELPFCITFHLNSDFGAVLNFTFALFVWVSLMRFFFLLPLRQTPLLRTMCCDSCRFRNMVGGDRFCFVPSLAAVFALLQFVVVQNPASAVVLLPSF